MDDPRTLRAQARLWHRFAPHHDTATAQAMEATARGFEAQADRLDRLWRILPPPPLDPAIEPPDWP
jgi:hypothetical protein